MSSKVSKTATKKSILITAGPTREHIDPVRFISNHSTGRFGYEIAGEAKNRGYRVVLVSGPTCIKPPRGIRLIRVESSLDMLRAVDKEVGRADCVIMAAAVSDWRPRTVSTRKIKRASNKKALELIENPDILKRLGRMKGGRILVGFALETEDLEKNAAKKLVDKNLDIIVANRLSRNNNIFGDNIIDTVMIDRFGNKTSLGGKSKRGLAKIILDKVESLNI